MRLSVKLTTGFADPRGDETVLFWDLSLPRTGGCPISRFPVELIGFRRLHAPFFSEMRMKFSEATKSHRKSGGEPRPTPRSAIDREYTKLTQQEAAETKESPQQGTHHSYHALFSHFPKGHWSKNDLE